MNESPDLVLAALAWLQRGQPQKALSTLERADAATLEDATAWFVRLAALAELERWEQGERAVDAALARFPEDVALLQFAAIIVRHRGQAGRAEQLLLAGLRSRPENIGLLCAYAELVAADGQLPKADALMLRAASFAPASDRVAHTRWVIANLRGDDEGARKIAAERLGRNPGDAHALTAMAIEELHVGEVVRAKALYGAAIDADFAIHDPELAMQLRVRRHPLYLGMWPVERWGPVPVTIGGIVLLQLVRSVAPPELTLVLVVVWIVYCLYTWLAPALLPRYLRSSMNRS